MSVNGAARQSRGIPTTVGEALYGKNFSFDARLRYIDNLTRTLAFGDVQLLLGYLKKATPDDGLKPEQRLAFSNDVIYALRIQQIPVTELTRILAGIFQDKTRAPGMRDYAIQHLSEWRWRAVQNDPAAAKQIDDLLWTAASETKQAYSGTALLALNRLVEDQKMPDHAAYAVAYKERLATAAFGIVTNGDAVLATRISAMGIYSEMGGPETALLATGLLKAKDTPPLLQLAALGALSKSLPAQSPLEPDLRATIEQAARSGYPPLKALAATTLRNHTF